MKSIQLFLTSLFICPLFGVAATFPATECSSNVQDGGNKQRSLVQKLVHQHGASAAPSEMRNNQSPLEDFQNKYLHMIAMGVTGSMYEEAGRCGGGKGGCAKEKWLGYDENMRENGEDWPTFGQTLVGHLGLKNLRDSIEDVISNKVEGDYAEVGVWRGGTGIYAKALLDIHGSPRHVHMFDAFERLPEDEDKEEYLVGASQEQLEHNFKKYLLLDNRVHFYKGLFDTSLPQFQGQIAVLRIDPIHHHSYHDALYYLYPKVPVGGIVILNDVFIDKGGLQAWTDFSTKQELPETLNNLGSNSAWFKKSVEINLNFTYYQDFLEEEEKELKLKEKEKAKEKEKEEEEKEKEKEQDSHEKEDEAEGEKEKEKEKEKGKEKEKVKEKEKDNEKEKEKHTNSTQDTNSSHRK